jgi:Flp pilus assembly pilin Flp
MINAITDYFKDESGAAVIEYSVMITVLSIVLIAIMIQVGVKFNDTMLVAVNTIKSVITPRGWDPNN